jgi:hypothetical protein
VIGEMRAKLETEERPKMLLTADAECVWCIGLLIQSFPLIAPRAAMSVCVREYWENAALTPMGLLQYLPDEIALYSTPTAHIDIECGGEGPKHTFQTGYAHVTSHRVVWVQERSLAPANTPPIAVALALDTIEKAQLKVSKLQVCWWVKF